MRAVKFRSLDPPYLLAKPRIPVYASLQFDVKSRDFVILERFPVFHCQQDEPLIVFITQTQPKVYRVNNLKAIHLPLLLDVLYQNLPEAVELSVRRADPKSDEDRYVPQLEVHALQDELSKLSK
ncbi:unnamed protein product [Dicrocoelium dendriticum]|nr:unnamed protein product [Dicrocoelium dendriticum]